MTYANRNTAESSAPIPEEDEQDKLIDVIVADPRVEAVLLRQRVYEYFVCVLYLLSQAVQHPCVI
jgi:hypothetical protein